HDERGETLGVWIVVRVDVPDDTRVVPSEQLGPAFGSAPLGQRRVARDGEEPRRELAFAVESLHAPLETDKHLLRDVVRGVLVALAAGESAGPGAHAGLDAGDEPLERGRFPGANLVNERRQVAVVAADHR